MEKPRNHNSQKRNRPRFKTNNTTPAVPSCVIEYAQGYIISLINDGTHILAGHYSSADATQDIKTVRDRIMSEGLGFATKTLPTLITGLLNALECHGASFPQFRLKRGTGYPVFLHRLFHLALESTDLRIKQNAFDILYSISVAFKKFRGDYPKKVLIKQFTDFVKTDKELDKLDLFEETTFSILEGARRYIATWTADFDSSLVKEFLPRPGPGATNTPTKKTERYRPRVLYKQIDDVLDYQEWWYPISWDACLRSRDFLKLHKEAVGEPTARFKFVPKYYGKPRGICIEENEMQVMQQAFRVGFYRFFDKHLYPNIALDEQDVNAQLALHASVDRENATIDMSEASDRVSRELVSWLFQDNQWLHDCLMALSTRWIKPPKELSAEFPNLIRSNKFAPMGSALCFPVMTLVHYALVLSIMEHDVLTIPDLHKKVYVYGDDIVVPSRNIDEIFYWLPKFGMKLNKTKSFYRSHFRESCGIHALHGRDVTPVYIKYAIYHDNADSVASACEVESQLQKKGLVLTAQFQRRKTSEYLNVQSEVPMGLSLAGFSRPFDDDDLRRFKIKHRRKWNVHLQCHTYLISRFTKQTVKTRFTSDDDAYLRWLWVHSKNEGPPGSPFGERVIGDSSGALITTRRLVPESALSEQKVSAIIEKAQLRYPIGRITQRRDSITCHKVVLRHSGNLQQQGAADCCVFC